MEVTNITSSLNIMSATGDAGHGITFINFTGKNVTGDEIEVVVTDSTGSGGGRTQSASQRRSARYSAPVGR